MKRRRAVPVIERQKNGCLFWDWEFSEAGWGDCCIFRVFWDWEFSVAGWGDGCSVGPCFRLKRSEARRGRESAPRIVRGGHERTKDEDRCGTEKPRMHGGMGVFSVFRSLLA